MSLVAFPGAPDSAGLAGPAAGGSVAAAIDRFLGALPTKTTRDTYAKTLTRLAAMSGYRPVADLAPEDYAAVMDRWTGTAAATWNRHLSALAASTRSPSGLASNLITPVSSFTKPDTVG